MKTSIMHKYKLHFSHINFGKNKKKNVACFWQTSTATPIYQNVSDFRLYHLGVSDSMMANLTSLLPFKQTGSFANALNKLKLQYT